MSQCLSGVCLGLYVSMSQISQCLRALPPLCLTASPSQCLRCLSVSGPSVSQPSPSQCLNVSMSQGGSAWASVAMSQCLNVSGGSAWASTERLNVSMSQLSRRGLPGPARSVSTSQLSRRGLPGPARRVSMSQCLSCLRAGFAWASTARLNVSMSQLSQGGSAWGRPGPAQSQCLNVSVSQGGLLGGDQDQRSRVSMSQCLREVCLKETRTSVAACLNVSGVSLSLGVSRL